MVLRTHSRPWHVAHRMFGAGAPSWLLDAVLPFVGKMDLSTVSRLLMSLAL